MDKYVKRKWVPEDEKDPVLLFHKGKWGRKKSKRSKKRRSKEEDSSDGDEEPAKIRKNKHGKKNKKEKAQESEATESLIDLESKDDDFGGFIDAGADNAGDDFTEFTSASTGASNTSPFGFV